MMEDVARRVARMLDNEAARKPDSEETKEHGLENLRKKYPWWLSGREGEESSTSPEKAESGDTVTLFEGRNTRVLGVRGKKKTTSSRRVCLTRTAGVVEVVYVNIVTLSVGFERVGELAKGAAVVSRPGTRVDVYSHHEQRS
jgi:hypothetical protein